MQVSVNVSVPCVCLMHLATQSSCRINCKINSKGAAADSKLGQWDGTEQKCQERWEQSSTHLTNFLMVASERRSARADWCVRLTGYRIFSSDETTRKWGRPSKVNALHTSLENAVGGMTSASSNRRKRTAENAPSAAAAGQQLAHIFPKRPLVRCKKQQLGKCRFQRTCFRKQWQAF